MLMTMMMMMMMLNTDNDEDNDDDEGDNNMKTTKTMMKTTTMTTTTMRERHKQGKLVPTLEAVSEEENDLFTLFFVGCLGPLLSHFLNQKVSLSMQWRASNTTCILVYLYKNTCFGPPSPLYGQNPQSCI